MLNKADLITLYLTYDFPNNAQNKSTNSAMLASPSTKSGSKDIRTFKTRETLKFFCENEKG